MRPRDSALGTLLSESLSSFDREVQPLPGLASSRRRCVLVEQMLESIHRVHYPRRLALRPHSARRVDPNDPLFDPLRAAIIHRNAGNLDEACWVVFLFVHFGKHSRGGWRYLREVYGKNGDPNYWTWANIKSNVSEFRSWLSDNLVYLSRKSSPGGFGNHRKYESLNAYADNGTGAAIASYIEWVGGARGHQTKLDDNLIATGGDPKVAFGALFNSMVVVKRFGRTAKFDYLAMLGRLDLTKIEPGLAYFSSATGPLKGARLLFANDVHAKLSAAMLESWVAQLDSRLGIGMQAIEDSLCNWQKSPDSFIRFRG